jgi:hypothetical protein
VHKIITPPPPALTSDTPKREPVFPLRQQEVIPAIEKQKTHDPKMSKTLRKIMSGTKHQLLAKKEEFKLS